MTFTTKKLSTRCSSGTHLNGQVDHSLLKGEKVVKLTG